MKMNYSYSLLTASVLMTLVIALVGADSHAPTSAPGFRPESELAGPFLKELPTSPLAVLPTLVRTPQGITRSVPSQKLVVNFLQEKKLGIPTQRRMELDLGEAKGKFQFDVFQSDLEKLGLVIRQESGADYYVMLEHLVTPTRSGGIALGGTHVYVLNAEGKNAFSFLLNSHHKIFVEAKLTSAEASEAERDALVLKGTKAALTALEEQIQGAAVKK